jgi:hypothetical protein
MMQTIWCDDCKYDDGIDDATAANVISHKGVLVQPRYQVKTCNDSELVTTTHVSHHGSDEHLNSNPPGHVLLFNTRWRLVRISQPSRVGVSVGVMTAHPIPQCMLEQRPSYNSHRHVRHPLNTALGHRNAGSAKKCWISNSICRLEHPNDLIIAATTWKCLQHRMHMLEEDAFVPL